jgi:hypothetical protein
MNRGDSRRMSLMATTILLSMAPGLVGALLRPLWRGKNAGEDPWKSQWHLITTRQDYETDDPSPHDDDADEQSP